MKKRIMTGFSILIVAVLIIVITIISNSRSHNPELTLRTIDDNFTYLSEYFPIPSEVHLN